MTIQYIANDGAVFYDEDECMTYERNLAASNLEGIVKFFGEDYNYLGSNVYAFEEAFYCMLIDPERLPQYLDYLKAEGYDLPSVTEPNTVYRWNFQRNRWENMMAIVEDLNDVIRMIKEEADIYEN